MSLHVVACCHGGLASTWCAGDDGICNTSRSRFKAVAPGSFSSLCSFGSHCGLHCFKGRHIWEDGGRTFRLGDTCVTATGLACVLLGTTDPFFLLCLPAYTWACLYTHHYTFPSPPYTFCCLHQRTILFCLRWRNRLAVEAAAVRRDHL